MGEPNRRISVEHGLLAAILAIAALLRLWRLEDNGFGTLYYAAGVRSALQGFSLLFYNSFDPAGFISLDKPPVTFWIQALFAKVLGFNGWAIHLPQALAGVASVAVLHRLVRGPFGPAAALIGAFVLAVTPVAVAIDRSNNTDSLLILFLLLAGWMALRGRGLALVLAMALLGVAFNVKMLAALVCAPAILMGWLLATPLTWARRFGWMVAAGGTLIVVSLSWVVTFDLTPAGQRPYAGSTQGNSMLELVVQHNGLERFVRLRPERPRPSQAENMEAYDAVPAGAARLAEPRLASQFAWLLPLSVAGLVLLRRRDRFDASLALWGMWAITYGVVFSLAGGIFHLYYLATLGPPLAALAGIGCLRLWRRGPAWLAIGLAVTALWEAYVASGQLGWTSSWLGFPLVALLAALGTLWRAKRPPAAIGGVALLVLPIAWALSPIFSPGNLILPSASLPRWLGIDDGRGPILSRNYAALSDDPKLIEFLTANRKDARYLLATPTANLAAPIIVRTGQAAMAVGGYFGNDPILTRDAFAALAKKGEVRYVLLGNQGRGGDFARWVRDNAKPVDESLWRSLPVEQRRRVTLYELKAD